MNDRMERIRRALNSSPQSIIWHCAACGGTDTVYPDENGNVPASGHTCLVMENAALLARVRELKAGLREYGDHKPMCNRHFTPGSTPYERGCNCGFDALAGDVK